MEKCSLYHICREGDVGDLSKGYIGITNNIDRRWSEHKSGRSKCMHLNNAVAKYDDIVYTTIEEGHREYIETREFTLRPEPGIGWNIAVGGRKSNTLGRPLSDDTKRKIGDSKRGRERTPAETEVLRRMADMARGRKHSEESIKLMSEKCRKGPEHHKWSGYWSCEGVIYNSSRDAAKAIGVSDVTVSNRVRNPKFPDYFKLTENLEN
ncbi:homing endonuclease [Vibrio phage D148]